MRGVLVAVALVGTCRAACDPCADGLCYTLYSGEDSPAAAEVKCEERGGHLAKVTTAAQIVAVKNVLKDVPDGNCPRFGAIEEAGSWRWTDGTAVSAIDIIEDAWGDGGHYCSCYWVDDDNVYDAPCSGGWGAGDYYLCATSEEAYTPNPDADWLAFQSWIQPNPMVYISDECTAMYYEEPDGGGYNYRYYTCESDGTINLYSCTCAEVSGHGHGCDGDDDNTVGSLWTVQANVCFNTDDGSYMFSCLDPTAAPTAAPTYAPTVAPSAAPTLQPTPGSADPPTATEAPPPRRPESSGARWRASPSLPRLELGRTCTCVPRTARIRPSWPKCSW